MNNLWFCGESDDVTCSIDNIGAILLSMLALMGLLHPIQLEFLLLKNFVKTLIGQIFSWKFSVESSGQEIVRYFQIR